MFSDSLGDSRNKSMQCTTINCFIVEIYMLAWISLQLKKRKSCFEESAWTILSNGSADVNAGRGLNNYNDSRPSPQNWAVCQFLKLTAWISLQPKKRKSCSEVSSWTILSNGSADVNAGRGMNNYNDSRPSPQNWAVCQSLKLIANIKVILCV